MDDPRRATWAGLGAALALTSFAVAAGVYTGAQNGLTVDSKHQFIPAAHMPLSDGFLVICYVLMVGGIYCVTAALFHSRWLPLPGVSRAEGLRKDPPLVVDFDATDPLCVQDRRLGHPQRDLQLRLRVSNIGPVGVNGVRLKVVDRKPDTAHLFYLSIMHDRPRFSASAVDGERCPSGGRRFAYFDFMFWSSVVLPTNPLPRPVLSYADEYLLVEQQIHSGPVVSQVITVEADGYWEDDRTSVAPSRQSIRVDFPRFGEMTLAPVPIEAAATATQPATGPGLG